MVNGPLMVREVGLGSVTRARDAWRREQSGISDETPLELCCVRVGEVEKRSRVTDVVSLWTVSLKSRLEGCFLPSTKPVRSSSAGWWKISGSASCGARGSSGGAGRVLPGSSLFSEMLASWRHNSVSAAKAMSTWLFSMYKAILAKCVASGSGLGRIGATEVRFLVRRIDADACTGCAPWNRGCLTASWLRPSCALELPSKWQVMRQALYHASLVWSVQVEASGVPCSSDCVSSAA